MTKKTYILLILLTFLTGCLAPKYYLWQDDKDQNYESLPWSEPDKKPVRQFKEELSIMSDVHRSDTRWKLSTFNTVPLDGKDSFRKDIERFLSKNNLLDRWDINYNGYSFLSEKGQFYQFKMVSINPTIIVVRPYEDEELILDKETLRYKDVIEYGTFIKFDKKLFYFSPDLDILPQPIDLSKNTTQTVYWSVSFDSGSIQFKKKRERVYINRFENEDGKDTKREGLYDADYHLKLIPREKEMKNIIKQNQISHRIKR